jgi:hypothetical protein
VTQYCHKILADGGIQLAEWQSDELTPLVMTTELSEALSQPYKIADVLAYFNNPDMTNAYHEKYKNFDWGKFDLVLVRETIWEKFSDIVEDCLEPSGIKNFLVLSQDLSCTDSRNLYRPFWFFRLIEENTFRDTNQGNKKFLFDALLGTPRDHRNYVMARFQTNPSLLTRSIITYRNEFNFTQLNLHHRTRELLGGAPLMYPFVSENLDPSWESDEVYKSGYKYFLDGIDVPWDIYQNTWYSVCTESAGNAGSFYDDVRITEKTARMFLAKRVFVLFGARGTLSYLRSQGFQTFSEIIDESYDNISDDHDRFSAAFDQVEKLAELDPVQVYQYTYDIREHNHHRLYTYRSEIKKQINQRLMEVIPLQYHN